MSDENKKPADKKPYRAVRTRTAGRGIADRVREIIQPTADELGYYLWDVEYVKEGADFILRVTIDRFDESGEGITIDDCEAFSRAIDPMLDEADPIADAYHLEISSPGVERDIKTPAHIEFCTGEMVEARLFAPLEGSRVHRGILQGMDEEGRVLLAIGENTLAIPRASISRMTTVFEF